MQKGFSKIFLVLIIVVVVLGGLFYLGGNSNALSYKNWSMSASRPSLQPVETAEGMLLSAEKEGDESVMFLNITLPKERDAVIDFLMKFEEKGDGDWLTVTFNDEQLFFFWGNSFFGEDFQAIGVPTGNFAGQTGVLKFTLHGSGSTLSSVLVKNLRLQKTWNPSRSS